MWGGRIIHKSQCSGIVATVSAAMWEHKVKGSHIYPGARVYASFWGILVHFAQLKQKSLYKKCKQSLHGDNFNQRVCYILLILSVILCCVNLAPWKCVEDPKVLRWPRNGGHKDLTYPTDKLTSPYNVSSRKLGMFPSDAAISFQSLCFQMIGFCGEITQLWPRFISQCSSY